MDYPESAFKELTHIDLSDMGGRSVPLLSYWDNSNSEWSIWLEVGTGELIKIPGFLDEGLYFGNSKNNVEDYHQDFIEFIYQRFCYPKVIGLLRMAEIDILNLACTIDKLDILQFTYLQDKSLVNTRMIVAEIEYGFHTVRSLFDILHNIVRAIVALHTEDLTPRPNPMKDSLSKTCMKDGEILTPEAIQARYRIPLPLCEFYSNIAPLFRWIQIYRDHIAHHGKSFDILSTDIGFAIDTKTEPFNSLDIWDESTLLPNNTNGLGSVRTAVGYLIRETLDCFDKAIEPIKSSFPVLPEIAPGSKLFLKVQNNSLSVLDRYFGDLAWKNRLSSKSA